MERIRAIVTPGASVTASVTGSAAFGASVAKAVGAPYGGSYEVTPTEEAQTLHVGGTTPLSDIIINPIPSNYGRIGYDGSVISVY